MSVKTDEEKNNEKIAFIYGLRDGLKFWDPRLVKYSEVDALDTAPDIKDALKSEYYTYSIGANLLPCGFTAAGIIYILYTKGPEVLSYAASGLTTALSTMGV